MCQRCRGERMTKFPQRVIYTLRKYDHRIRQIQTVRKYWKLIFLDESVKGKVILDYGFVRNSTKQLKNRYTKKYNPPRYVRGEEVGWYRRN